MFTTAKKDFIPINLDEMRFPGFLQKRAREMGLCVENVAKGKGWQDMPTCPVCGEKDRKVIFTRFEIDIVQCAGCGCGYVEKFPVDTGDVYSDADYLPIAQSDYLDHVDYRQQRFGAERLNLIGKYLQKSPSAARLLDVGCGTGWFLQMAQKAGYKVAGQEWGKSLAKFTADRLKINVWTDALTQIDTSEKFDVITLFDVIEHVPNPREVIQSIADHLNPGGISLLFTPNLDSFAFEKLKEISSLVMPVEHLFYFTRSSLERLIKEAGLEVACFATKGMDIPDIYSYYRDEVKQEQVAEFLREHCDYLQAMIDNSGHANHMRFIVRKK